MDLGRVHGCCLNNLLVFLNSVTNSLDKNDSVDVIYLDFSEVFDKVLTTEYKGMLPVLQHTSVICVIGCWQSVERRNVESKNVE